MDIIKIDQNIDGSETINCNFPIDNQGREYNLHVFLQDQKPELLKEFTILAIEHDQMVKRAIAAGDAAIVNDGENKKILWVSDKVHEEYCNTIEDSHNQRYHEFWEMYNKFVRNNF